MVKMGYIILGKKKQGQSGNIMYILLYLVSCKLQEFQNCFKCRCEKLVFYSDYLEGGQLVSVYVR